MRELLDDLSTRYPAIRGHLLDDGGELNRFVNVYVNNEDVRLGDGLDTARAPEATVIVLPAMAGGAEPLAAASRRARASQRLPAIGNTPLVELPRDLAAGRRPHLRQARGAEPDRLGQGPRGALSMIEAAEVTGELQPGQRILEPTSGNTGISLAMIGKVKGYPVSVVMPESATPERVELLRMYGAEIIFSPGELGSNGAVAMARELAERDPSLFMPFQYANEANPAAHYCGTALEILEQVPDGQVDAFVAGLGTGGTLMGTGRRLREENPDVQIVAAEPLQGDPVMGLRSLEDGYTPPILDIRELDRKVLVSNAEAVLGLRKLLDAGGHLRAASPPAPRWRSPAASPPSWTRAERGRAVRRRRLEVHERGPVHDADRRARARRWRSASGGDPGGDARRDRRARPSRDCPTRRAASSAGRDGRADGFHPAAAGRAEPVLLPDRGARPDPDHDRDRGRRRGPDRDLPLAHLARPRTPRAPTPSRRSGRTRPT